MGKKVEKTEKTEPTWQEHLAAVQRQLDTTLHGKTKTDAMHALDAAALAIYDALNGKTPEALLDAQRGLDGATTGGTWSALIEDYNAGTMFITNDRKGSQEPLARGLIAADAAAVIAAHNDRVEVLDVIESAEAVRAVWEDHDTATIDNVMTERDLVTQTVPKMVVLSAALDRLFRRWADR